MSNSNLDFNKEELEGSVDFDFFSDGDESNNKGTQRSDASGGKTQNEAAKSVGDSHRSRSPTQPDDPPTKRSHSSSRSRSKSRSRSRSKSRSRSSSKSASESRSRSRSRSPSRSRSRSPASEKNSARSPQPPPPADKHRRRRHSSASSSSASDVTDVSPLSSRENSPVGRPPKPAGRAAGGAASSTRSLPGERPPPAAERDEDRLNVETIMRALMQMDRKQQQRAQSAGARQRSGRGLNSQSMSRMNEIDSENQRLLYNLMKTKSREKASSIDPPVKRPHHSTVNRQREQRRIEEENRKIFQRLKQVRPTKGMTRTEMISDYKKQASFGLPLRLQGEEVKFRQPKITQNPYCQPLSRVHSSASMAHRSRPSSAASSREQQQQRHVPVASGRADWPSGW